MLAIVIQALLEGCQTSSRAWWRLGGQQGSVSFCLLEGLVFTTTSVAAKRPCAENRVHNKSAEKAEGSTCMQAERKAEQEGITREAMPCEAKSGVGADDAIWHR